MDASEAISGPLKQPAEAAVAWLNQTQNSQFELTGVIEPETPVNNSGSYEIGLVLCDGELCARQQVRVTPRNNGFEFSRVEQDAPLIPPLLDPPKGLRAQWIDEQLGKFDFILLLFYRGRW